MQAIRMTLTKQSLSEAKQESEKTIAIHNALMERWLKQRTERQNQQHNIPDPEPIKYLAEGE